MRSAIPFILGLPLLTTASSLLPRDETPFTVDYEDPVIAAGVDGVSNIEFRYGPYKDLEYSFLFFKNIEATSMFPIAKPEKAQGIVGITGSTIKIPDGSAVKSIKPMKISLVPFLAGGTSVNKPVAGKVKITATKLGGTPYDTFVTCEYTITDALVGKIKEFSLHPDWNKVTSMSFELFDTTGQQVTSTLANVKKAFGLTNVVGGGAGAVASTAFVGDKFVYYKACKSGAPDPTDGLCK